LIFIATGTQVNGFDRLIAAVDALLAEGILQEETVAQIGHGNYIPRHMTYKAFMDKDEYDANVEKADLIISHGGTGALVGALKKGKQVIAVPRLKMYHEHLDDHQKQITGVLSQQGYLLQVTDMAELGDAIRQLKAHPITKQYDIPSRVLPIIEEKLAEWFGDKQV